jgi:predicted MFS family arabinose efflux permease
MLASRKIMYFGVFFSSVRMLIGATSAIFLMKNGVSIVQIGYLKSFQAAVIMLLDVPLAYWADKQSRKFSVVFSVLFASLWLLISVLGAVQGKVLLFYVAEFFNAISLALLSGTFTAYLIDSKTHDEKIHEVVGKYNSYQFVGMAVAALIGSFLFEASDYKPWLLAGGICFFLFALSVFLLPDYQKTAVSKKTTIKEDLEKSWVIFKQDRVLMAEVALIAICAALFYQVLIQFWQPLAETIQVLDPSAEYFGVLFFLLLMGQSVSGHWVSKVKNSASIKSLSLSIAFISMILFFLGIFLKNLLLPLSIIVVFFANRFQTIGMQSIFHENVPTEMRSTFDSFLSAITRVCILIAMPIFAYMLDHLGWLSLACFYMLTLISQFVMSRKKPISHLNRV